MPNPKIMTTSPAGVAATLFREGLRLKAYLDTADVWTIGTGDTRIPDPVTGEMRAVREGDTITEEQAAENFAEDMRYHEKGVGKYIDVDLTQYQFDVLSDMCFQYGVNFLWSAKHNRPTGLMSAINEMRWHDVEGELSRWYYAGGKRDDGVYNRCMSRVCQWNAVPSTIWKKVCYGGAVLMKLHPKTNAIQSIIAPEIVLARARGFAAAPRSSPPASEQRVPTPAPAKKPKITSEPQAPKADPPPKPPASIPPPKPPGQKTVALEDIEYPHIHPANGSKELMESERFWGSFWIAAGQILQAYLARGGMMVLIPSWAAFMAVDMLQNPVALGVLSMASATVGGGILAAVMFVRRGVKKVVVGRQTATQVLH